MIILKNHTRGCPFCNGHILEIIRDGCTKQTSTAVWCPRCGCRGPSAANKRAAESKWRHRIESTWKSTAVNPPNGTSSPTSGDGSGGAQTKYEKTN